MRWRICYVPRSDRCTVGHCRVLPSAKPQRSRPWLTFWRSPLLVGLRLLSNTLLAEYAERLPAAGVINRSGVTGDFTTYLVRQTGRSMSYLFFSEPKNKSRAARRAIKPTIIGLQLKTSLSGSSVPESPCAIAHPVAGAVSCYSPPAERSFDLHPEADHRRRHPPQGYWASRRYPESPCRWASSI